MTLEAAVAVILEHGYEVRRPPRPVRSLPIATQVIAEVGRQYGVTRQALCGPKRHALISVPRRACYWALRQMGLSLPEIGRQLGGAHHTSVLHGLRHVRLSEAKAALRAIRIVEARSGERIL